MTPIQLREALESRGLLDAAEGPGVYALRVAVPHSVEAVQRAWLNHYDEALADHKAAALAEAAEVEYIGASKHVRERLIDHAEGKVRKASLVHVYGIEAVPGVWPRESVTEAFEHEVRRAMARSEPYRATWANGDLF